jgi:hypothetical protein
MHYRYRETVYHIAVLQTPAGIDGMHVTVDGIERPDQTIPLVDDRKEHQAEVRIPVTGGWELAEGTPQRNRRLLNRHGCS